MSNILKFLVGTPAILLIGWAGAANAAVVPDSDHVAKLLAEAKTLAFQLKDDAVAMEGFTRMNVAWETHAVAINQIREHVNALETQEAKLKDARTEAAPWQKTAIPSVPTSMRQNPRP
jgi:hypothetical protein